MERRFHAAEVERVTSLQARTEAELTKAQASISDAQRSLELKSEEVRRAESSFEGKCAELQAQGSELERAAAQVSRLTLDLDEQVAKTQAAQAEHTLELEVRSKLPSIEYTFATGLGLGLGPSTL